MRILSLLLSIFLVGCASTAKDRGSSKPKFSQVFSSKGARVVSSKQNSSKAKAFKGKILYKELEIEGDWIGGTEKNPIYYTRKGERIYSLGRDIFVYPVTTLSTNIEGKVVYPEDGIKLIGDMSVVHFLSLVKALNDLNASKTLCFEADSNFLEKPAKVIDLKKNKVIGKYLFKNDSWDRID